MRTTFRREDIGEMGLGKDQDIFKTVEIDVLFLFSSLFSLRRTALGHYGLHDRFPETYCGFGESGSVSP